MIQSHEERTVVLMAKTTTSTEVKNRWKKKAYKIYRVNLRYDTDHELMEFIDSNKDSIGLTQMFREALEMYMNANK